MASCFVSGPIHDPKIGTESIQKSGPNGTTVELLLGANLRRPRGSNHNQKQNEINILSLDRKLLANYILNTRKRDIPKKQNQK